MNKYCAHCGALMAQDQRFCAICGTASNNFGIQQQAVPKKLLSNHIINKDLHNQRHTVWEYLGQALLAGLMVLVVALGRPGVLIFGIFIILNVIRMIREDIRRSMLRYYVLERPCIEKSIAEFEDSPDQHLLWFENQNKQLLAALDVAQPFYDATQPGEEFYVVFLEKDKLPCLCYRKSEWLPPVHF